MLARAVHAGYNEAMVSTILDKMLQPATDQMPIEFARMLLDLRADGDLRARMDDLRAKANAGIITSEEDAEYKEFIEAIDILSILQLKARRIVSSHSD